MAALDVIESMIEPMIHVIVPLKHMEMSPKPEPEAEYSEKNIKRWREKLVLTGRAQEAAMILRLAFTRPRLHQVMKLRKAISTGQRRQASLAAGRRYMASQRAAQQATGVSPRPRPKAKAKAKSRGMPLMAIADGIM